MCLIVLALPTPSVTRDLDNSKIPEGGMAGPAQAAAPTSKRGPFIYNLECQVLWPAHL